MKQAVIALLLLAAQAVLALHQFEHKIHVAEHHGELDCEFCVVPGSGGPLPDPVAVLLPPRAVYFVPAVFEDETAQPQHIAPSFRSRAPPPPLELIRAT